MGKKKNNKQTSKVKITDNANEKSLNRSVDINSNIKEWSKYEYVKYIAQAVLIIFTLDYANREIMKNDGRVKNIWLTYDLTLAPILASIAFLVMVYIAIKFIDNISIKNQNKVLIISLGIGLFILYITSNLGGKVQIAKAPFIVIFIIMLAIYEYAKKKGK